MSADNFDKSFALTLRHEGGFVNHPKDPGGATNLGITKATLEKWLGRKVTIAEMKLLTPAIVQPIYKQRYWDEVNGDKLPKGLDYAVYDFAVNSGPARAAMALQRLVGVADDGHIGPLTLKAIAKHDVRILIDRLCTERLAFMQRLSNWPVFGGGWRRRVIGVEKEAFKMVAA